ncbi:MAG TPA: thrombospondin type 3 repeat-containing protein [Polyangiaceae bacterium]
MSRTGGRVPRWNVALVLSFAAGPVAASEAYAPALADALELDCAPACTLCHTRPEGGLLTANTPFGTAARRARLPCCDPGSLEEVLTRLEAERIDSDGDGSPDVEELRAGRDPNGSGETFECLSRPEESGCRVASGVGVERSELALLLGALAGLTWRARRRVAGFRFLH